MDDTAKKTALRMIPYGIYILTAKSGADAAAATVNWVTQTSFEPPLIAVAIKSDSGAYALIKKTQVFALNMLGKGQAPIGFTFFKPAQLDGSTISGPSTAGKVIGLTRKVAAAAISTLPRAMLANRAASTTWPIGKTKETNRPSAVPLATAWRLKCQMTGSVSQCAIGRIQRIASNLSRSGATDWNQSMNRSCADSRGG